eukprot:symbB.v1.2.033945.t1/scaffold4293.1/size41805/1
MNDGIATWPMQVKAWAAAAWTSGSTAADGRGGPCNWRAPAVSLGHRLGVKTPSSMETLFQLRGRNVPTL